MNGQAAIYDVYAEDGFFRIEREFNDGSLDSFYQTMAEVELAAATMGHTMKWAMAVSGRVNL